MTKEELAARLNGRAIDNEITKAEEAEAKAAGLVVVFGASDDLMEFRGAVSDEFSCYSGGTVYVMDREVVTIEEDCGCRHERAALASIRKHGRSIEAVWDENGWPWTYRTAIPHATFEIREDGEEYCRGIVFALKDAR